MSYSPYSDERATRPRWVAYAVVVAALLLVALAARWFASAGAAKNARSGRPPAAVAVVPVTLADMPVTVSAIGTVTPVDVAAIRSQIAGTVKAVRFTEGQMVRAGQVLVEVDPRPYRLQLAQAEGAIARDTAQLAAARADLKRYETLVSQDSAARQALDNARASVGQLEGTLAADRASAGTARLNLDYAAVKAPFAGRIGLKQVSLGSYVTPADVNGVASIARTDPIDVVFAIPQAQLAAVQAKGSGLPVVALDQDGKRELAQGRFATFDNQIDPATGTVKGKARFANPQHGNGPALFPNQFVNVRMLVDTLSHTPTVPVSALRHGAPGDFVFVLQPDSTVKLVVVRPGPSDGTRTAILSGLQAGQMVVAEGADGLDAGSPVRRPGAGKPGEMRGGGRQRQRAGS